MRVLVTGSGRSGSWQIRGVQLGRAIGARVVPSAPADEIRRADLVIAVKRVPDEMLPLLADHPRVVWDVVDAWPQPAGQEWTQAEALAWLSSEMERIKPFAVVWPTRRMQADAGWSGPQITLPHHAWDKYSPRPLGGPVHRVGYEGAARYLGRWREVLQRACTARGWLLDVNGDMQRADIGIALRDGECYAARHWKSNCKLANLQALGIPALCSPECGYQETASGGELWVGDPAEIDAALDAVIADRERLGALMRAATLTVDAVAEQYRGWIDAL